MDDRPRAGICAAKSHKERLMTLVFAGVLALNYPLLFLFSSADLLFGIPVFYLYLFLTWAIFIALAALVLEAKSTRNLARPGSRPDAEVRD